MAATASRIGFVMQPFRLATSETAGVETRHGTLARKDTEPQETFFDDLDDAQTMADARQTLLSPERRRFGVTAKGLDAALDMDIAGPVLPVGSFNDPQRGIAIDVVVAEIGFDFAAQKATTVVWG